MRHTMKKISTSILILSVVAITGCLEKAAEELPSEISGGGGSGGGSSLFTASDISNGSSKSWVSDCVAYHDATLGTEYYQQHLTLQSNGAFSLQHYAYTAPGTNQLSPCANPDYKTIFITYGAYSVGSELTTGVQAIAFAVASSDLMVTDALTVNHSVTQDIFNSDCGGTSPFCSLVNQSCVNNGKASGTHNDSQSMQCQHFTFVTNNTTVYNIGSYSNGVLTLGAGPVGLPGITNVNSLSGISTTVNFH